MSDEFLNLGALTDSVSQVVQLSAAYFTTAENVDVGTVRRMQREGLFHADPVCNAANGEGFGDAAAVLADDGAFKKLDSFTCTLFDKVVNSDSVTYVERCKLCL